VTAAHVTTTRATVRPVRRTRPPEGAGVMPPRSSRSGPAPASRGSRGPAGAWRPPG
jgi:hypothetical protein